MNENLEVRKNSQAGFSLVEAMISLSFAVIVSLVSASVVLQGKEMETSADFQATLDQTHIMTLQKIRNVSNLTAAFGISGNQCFGKAGTGCTSLINPATGPLPPLTPGDENNNVCVGPPQCLIRYTVQYQTNCSATKCDSIALTVTTRPDPVAINLGYTGRIRTTRIVVPGFMFAGKVALDFTCAGTSIPVSIDYKNLQVNCGGAGFTATECASQMPLMGFTGTTATCSPPVSNACGAGLQAIGLFPGQTTCI